LWRRPARRYLEGGLGTLPLAPLCNLGPGKPVNAALAPIIRRIDERLAAEAPAEDRAQLLAATFIVTGLRLARGPLLRLFEGIHNMKESSAYQAILDEGRAEGRLQALQEILLRLGGQHLGPAGKTVQAAARGGRRGAPGAH
jgi:hypothetical protein